jgi:ClpP class serine protease
VKGVVFEVDSYGGEVAGVFETARMIRELSAAKPTIAILTDFAYSAGYLLAAAARQIVLPETGGAGSIGVMTMHADFSKQLAAEGVKVTLIYSGSHKVDANPLNPLPEDVRARLQAGVDRGRDLFADAVGAFRGKRLTKAMALATEAQSYRGEEAVAAGLADAVIDPTRAFDAFVKRVN